MLPADIVADVVAVVVLTLALEDEALPEVVARVVTVEMLLEAAVETTEVLVTVELAALSGLEAELALLEALDSFDEPLLPETESAVFVEGAKLAELPDDFNLSIHAVLEPVLTEKRPENERTPLSLRIKV